MTPTVSAVPFSSSDLSGAKSKCVPRVLRFPLCIAVAAFVSWTVLRVALYLKFRPAEATLADTVKVFTTGLHFDVVMALAAPVMLMALAALLTTLGWVTLAPLTFIVPGLRPGRLWRVLFRAVATGCCVMGVFAMISEWFFFEEFTCRFNTVAIDYLLYTHEVFTNIWESYPVPAIIAACVIGGGGFAWVLFRRYAPDWRGVALFSTVFGLLLGAGALWAWSQASPLPAKITAGVAGVALAAVLVRLYPRSCFAEFRARAGAVLGWLAAAVLGWFSMRPAETAFSGERVMNELANNGWASAIRAAITRNLDFSAHYATIPQGEAFSRLRGLMAEPGVTFAGPEAPPEPKPGEDGKVSEEDRGKWLDAARLSITRDVAGDAARPKLNVCIILVESLGSDFVGSLGRVDKEGKPETLTPEMDLIAAQEGFLFTQLLADGNRTIRGFEAVYSSIPPLPGDSILARDKTDRVETIGRVLKRDGYQSLFIYGGRGTFDYISGYVLPNGWDRLIEEKDYPNPAHTTAWGVSDEDIYHRGIEEMRAMHQTGQPFLVSFMTVSNHKPYTYPAGRIPENPDAKIREHAVKYSDWALGDFFRRAKAEPFWKDTIFVVAGDHGARVYGSQTIPLQSYRIPMLIAGPCAVPQAQRVEVPGCQLDVAPTILGIIGRPYRTLFFGHDLLKPGAGERSRGLMHHNRSIAIYRDTRQVVFGLNKSTEYWQGDIGSGRMSRVSTPDTFFENLQRDGTAMFVVADALYTHYRYILPE